MACIIQLPVKDLSKGILTFTTAERDSLILKNNKLKNKIFSLKSEWIIGLHHNWHDHNFKYNDLFDFSMAGEDDLIPAEGYPHPPIIPLDACNFTPTCFSDKGGDKFWDVLYIARAVFFKGICEFFQCIRELYDRGNFIRVLFICPVPPYSWRYRKSNFYDIREVYDKLFSAAEKERFTLLTMNYEYPFPLDLETLAHFYRSSKVFVHFADNERRCRVAAYAWCSGLPVVGKASIGSILPTEYRTKPYFYEVNENKQFSDLILTAIDNSTTKYSSEIMHSVLREDKASEILIRCLLEKYPTFKPIKDKMALTNLSLRLGRHHGIGSGPNTVPYSLEKFIDILGSSEKQLESVIKLNDPELALTTINYKQSPCLSI